MPSNRQLREQAILVRRQECIDDLNSVTLADDLSENQRRDHAILVLVKYLEDNKQTRIAYAFRSALVGDFL